VLAPAGSGKTKTLINRVLHLLNQGIPAAKILALAFNKKARDEMQERLERKNARGIEVRTFHSLGYEIVREGLGWAFNESHRQTTRDLMSAAVRQHVELPSRRNADPLDAFLDALSRAKMELPPLSNMTVEFGEQLYPFESIFNTYLQKQTAANHFDFDDMIYLAIRALLKNTALRRAYQSKFEFVLVDEFQDLNQAQLLLLQILGLPENNIFAVGDDDQMIYGFRGAQVRHLVQFDKRFSISESHTLNTNYRSSRMVVRHTGWLIDHNKDRVPKDIRPRPGAQTGRFEVSGHASLLEQARFAAAWIAGQRKQTGADWRDYAVLYRYNAYQFPIAVMLDKLGIPHASVSNLGLFKSAPGRDICATLQVILSPLEASPADFERILKRPNKYLTNQLIAQARDWDSFPACPKAPACASGSKRRWEISSQKSNGWGKKSEQATFRRQNFCKPSKSSSG
jgi:DNA helicase II / ATP-dependent DNA helicase PcrA